MFDLSKLFNSAPTTSGIPALYSFSTPMDKFLKSDITSTYKKILIDVVEKCAGLPSKYEHIWWDSCAQSESRKGLLSLIVDAMFNQSELFIVYKADVIRVATSEEQRIIKDDYKKSSGSKNGAYVSFQNYDRTDMLRIYSILEYCLLHSLHKQMNLSRAIEIKIKGLRSNVNLGDAQVAIDQAKVIAEALARGEEVMLDKEDEITTPTVDTSPTEKGMSFLEAKKSEILGMPTSYISGEQTSGIGSTGEADMRAVEKGLKQYFYSILRPIIKDLLNVTMEFRSDDFRYISTSLEVLKSFEVTSSELLSTETKRAIIARSFGLDLKEEEKRIEKELKEEEEREKSRPVFEEEIDEDEE